MSGAGDDRVFQLKAVDVQPIPVSRTRPTYPTDLRRKGIEGEAVVDFVIGKDGFVESAKAIKETAPGFGEVARAAVDQWQFKPAQVGGHPVRCHMQVPIVFSLDDIGRLDRPALDRRLPPGTQIYELSRVDRQPVPRLRIPPIYPKELRKAGVEGKVIVDFVIAADGHVSNAVIKSATHPALAATAIDAVRRWVFKPAFVGNKPVNCHLVVPIGFNLTRD